MTLVIELPDNKESALKAKAESLGISAEQYAQEVLDRDLSGGGEQPVSAMFNEIWSGMPEDVRAKLPRDGADQIDNYIYGSKERTVKAVFANTFYWVALFDASDPRYQDALTAESNLAGAKIITTDEVLSEFLTFIAGDPWLRERASPAVQGLLNSASVQVVPQSWETFLSGLDLYRQRPDKGYSLADCISMKTMQRQGITDALTNDRHFVQEGFRALFR